MISLRAACVVFAAIAAGLIPALTANAAAVKRAHHPGAKTVGLFSLGSYAPADEPVLAADEPMLGQQEPGPVILAQDIEERADATDLADASLSASEPFDPSATRLYESTWYTRMDYLQWQETFEGERYRINEGFAPTFGWQQRRGRQRYRFDFFGSQSNYLIRSNGELVRNVTDYLGLRAEYELLWEPVKLPSLSLFAGVGSRYFVRSAPDFVDQGMLIPGYQQSWWTLYPYVGYETRRTMKTSGELYARFRFGMTAFTREYVSNRDVVLFPRPNGTMQWEVGWRGPRLALACVGELMEWSVSPWVLKRDGANLYLVRQPESELATLGGKITWSH